MKLNLALTITLLITLGACSIPKKVTVNSANLKDAAKDFSLSIIKSYFNEDCYMVYTSVSDSILLLDGDGIIAKKGKEDKICQSLKKAVRDKEKSFQDYLVFYNVEILTPNEIYVRFNRPLPEYYKLTESDFFFLGYELKKGKDHADNFIWDDMFVFMVRKENGVWKIKGVTG